MTTAPPGTGLSHAVRAFASAIRDNFAVRVDAQPEDQLKGPVQELLRVAGSLIGRTVSTRTEARIGGLGARPDVGVAVDDLLTGHVELKAPGKGARPERFRGPDRLQWEKFRSLPNLLYTDGIEWSLQRTGREVARVRLTGDIRTHGGAAVSDADARALESLLTAFLSWQPVVPTSPRALAETLAPLCRLLRHDVLAAVVDPTSALAQLAEEWRRYLFPDADDDQFADAYAQTVTYALLLARLTGASVVDTDGAARALRHGHNLLAQALRILTDEQARVEIDLPIELLERSIAAVDVDLLHRHDPNPWLYFYEDFLAVYDPKLRKDRGVYYTPAQVVRAQVRLVAELLADRFSRPLTYADEGVVLLDPAAGTGTYPLAAMADALERVRQRYGEGAVPGRATELAQNVHAFEILIGPYAVAHLRLTQEIRSAGGEVPVDGVHVYLTDTLESPHAAPPGQLPLLARPLAEEHRRAQRVKAETRVFVCIGNPPYDRQVIDPGDLATARKGGWVRFGERGEGGILEDFLAPARAAGAGVHLKNLYNDYVYFWRWALWKVFESTDGPGIVSFISASSYLRGPGFVGMREWMRRTFDELWIIDLEGDNLGARRTENVFAIQTPVAIAVGVRYGGPRPDEAAVVRYTRIEGSRDEKLAALDGIRSFADLAWSVCGSAWHDPFLPRTAGNYWAWPLVTDIFPWQHTGVETKRPWTIGPSASLLRERWRRLLSRRETDRAEAYHQTRDRRANRSYPALFGRGRLDPIQTLSPEAGPESIERYAFRSLDRQWVVADGRVGDFLRPALWRVRGERQVFLTSLLSGVLGPGPAATVAAEIPDLHHFRGSFGGKDVVPLWRDPAGTVPNVTGGLLECVSEELGRPIGAEDLFAYAYAVLATPEYVLRFSEELTIPGPRLPITKDPVLFERASRLGRRLVWLHTYGARMTPEGETPGRIPQGRARATAGIPSRPDAYPDEFTYEAETKTLHVGSGSFTPVEPEVWSFSISGLQVVRSWLAYRMKSGAGRRSSPLDEIRPERWTAQLTEELLELLWVIEATLALYPELSRLLAEIVAGPVFEAVELPSPSPEERR
ncbi:MAG TPA: type ISP restriction/modification enzyme, partial [Candidatus Limnocylindrales bacterium]|nr:type ISP restriction/modification enzyme [Candidatus Limnocylindrales bacterium]